MENRKLTKQEIEAWEKFYAKDLLVIGDFVYQEPNKNYRLYFKDGTQIIVYYTGGNDGDNGLDLDDPYYEDLYELNFKVVKIEKKGIELDYMENQCFSLTYHDFFTKFEPYDGDA